MQFRFQPAEIMVPLVEALTVIFLIGLVRVVCVSTWTPGLKVFRGVVLVAAALAMISTAFRCTSTFATSFDMVATPPFLVSEAVFSYTDDLMVFITARALGQVLLGGTKGLGTWVMKSLFLPLVLTGFMILRVIVVGLTITGVASLDEYLWLDPLTQVGTGAVSALAFFAGSFSLFNAWRYRPSCQASWEAWNSRVMPLFLIGALIIHAVITFADATVSAFSSLNGTIGYVATVRSLALVLHGLEYGLLVLSGRAVDWFPWEHSREDFIGCTFAPPESPTVVLGSEEDDVGLYTRESVSRRAWTRDGITRVVAIDFSRIGTLCSERRTVSATHPDGRMEEEVVYTLGSRDVERDISRRIWIRRFRRWDLDPEPSPQISPSWELELTIRDTEWGG